MSTWRLFVDTGGTFTDCLAIDPGGALHRVKVLSSSALRGRVAERDGRRLAVRFGRELPAGFLRGFRLACGGERRTIVEFDDVGSLLTLDAPAPDAAVPGAAVEAASFEEAPILAARLVTGAPPGAPLPPIDLRLATTRGTNALLERRGARTALVVTRGFGDLLAIGDQRRPRLFSLDVRRPPPLADVVVEVDERIDAQGAVLLPLRDEETDAAVERLRGAGAEAVAIALMHAWRNPAHEERLAQALERAGFRHCWRSSASPEIGLLGRAVAATVNAYLSPVVQEYVERIEPLLSGGRLSLLTSAAGLVPARRFAPKDSLLSGPAGGVCGAAAAARRSGLPRVLAFDMGGTSTDVSRLDGPFHVRFSHRVGDAEVAATALAIETVAAGGGSVIDFDGAHLTVGPRSAGADPGPACYGRGGPLTLTDANLLLGRLDPARFEIPIERDVAAKAADAVLAAAARAGRPFPSREAMLAGALALADERMADAIAAVSIRQGVEVSGYALLAFGGAGGLHACGVAERLGLREILLPEDAGLLSAVGLMDARPQRDALRMVLAPLPQALERLRAALREAGEEARGVLLAEGSADDAGASMPASAELRQIVRLRLPGQETCVEVDVGGTPPEELDDADLRRAFAEAYERLYGHRPKGGEGAAAETGGERPDATELVVEVESVRVLATAGASGNAAAAAWRRAIRPAVRGASGAARSAPVWCGAGWRSAPVLEVESLTSGEVHEGPALLLAAHASAWVAPGWRVRLDEAGAARIERTGGKAAAGAPSSLAGAAAEEIVAARLTGIAVEMGELLRRTAVSTNVKERLDYSCGVLDAFGGLVVNAPHVPVHLGALGACVRAVAAALDLAPGDVAVTNHPGFGGSHLPDLTVITPVHASDGAGSHGDGRPTLLGYVASRAHHAELGGTRPGSMPPFARSLAEEAVVVPPRHLVRRGAAQWDAMARLLREAPHPTRALAQNLADLGAAVAANHHGAERLRDLAAELGPSELAARLRTLQDRAARLCAASLAALPAGRREAIERLDDGSTLAVVVEIEHGRDGARARLDFTGSAAVHPGNFNATEAVVRSAAMYVLRLLIEEELPLNEGLLRPISIHVPVGMLNPLFVDDPARCPAVGAGNTETSQRLVDLLLKAFGVVAASQGTMNNFLFGVEGGARDGDREASPFGYYETIGGGAGAGPEFDGASATHVHMTNTRITDAEILEHRHPVLVERFAIRRGSGGAGRRRGGDGIVRAVRFLAPMSVSLVTQRRTSGPYGVAGGADGAPGRNVLVRRDGRETELPSVAALEVEAGDVVRIETPGGGGWGEGR